MSRPGVDARLRGGGLVIQVSRKVLTFATNNHPDFWDAENDKQTIKVTDIAGFVRDVAAALNDEGEDGSTPITRMLDAAILHAIEQGSEHVEEMTPTSGEV
jgi:hypothetical protein